MRCYCKKCAKEFDWPFRIEQNVPKADAIGECMLCGDITMLSKDWSTTEMTCRECNCAPGFKLVVLPLEDRVWDRYEGKEKLIKMCHLGVIERRQLCYYHKKKAEGWFNLPVDYFREQHGNSPQGRE